MNVLSVLQLLGGIGLFLYGMNLLSTSLKKIAGPKLEKILEKLTNNRIKGVLLGAAVTAVIQSSSATAIMVTGFVNAGIMKLLQAIPVIMGANIGTTVTAQILRLGDISADNVLLALLKPSSFAPICIAIGAAIILITKKKRPKHFAGILVGFGVLFTGITTMETVLGTLKDVPAFQELFFAFRNPLLGVLLGALVTTILQSSSASVGVLQALSSTGNITFSIAAPIIMGQNIGKCVTVLIGSIGGNKKAKRAVLIDILINIIGVILFFVVIYGYQALIGFSFWNDPVSRGNIADFHTLFNVVTTIVLLPFCNALVTLSGWLLKDDEESKIDRELALLDDMFLKTPHVALQQCKKVIFSMGESVKENFRIATGLLESYNDKQRTVFEENENFLDRTETVLGDYLVKITGNDLSVRDNNLATEIMHTIGDFERIGDYCVNLSEVAEYNFNENVAFSETGLHELHYVSAAAGEIINMTVQAYTEENLAIAAKIEPLEETIDALQEMLKSKHVYRLQNGLCNTQSGISFVEVLSNIERIADHCSNIAVHLTRRVRNMETFDAHSHLQSIHEGVSPEYRELCRHYESLYCDPIR